jgi:hypothetical protein
MDAQPQPKNQLLEDIIPAASQDVEGGRDYYNSHEVRQSNNQQIE